MKNLLESLLDDDDALFKRTSLNFKDIVDYNHIECYLDNQRCKLSDIAMLQNRGKFNEIRDEQLANKDLKSYDIPKLLCDFDFNRSQQWGNTYYYEEMLKAALNAVISFSYDERVFINGLDNYLNPGYFLFWRFNGNRNKDYYKYTAKLNTGEKAELRLYKHKGK